VDLIANDLAQAWGSADAERRAEWPLTIRAGRV